jgi:hypothetical protein
MPSQVRLAALTLSLITVCLIGALHAAETGGGKIPDYDLPKDGSAVVLSLRYLGGMIWRPEAKPYLQIQADGKVLVHDAQGNKKEGQLTSKELQDLLRFVLREQDFMGVTKETIAAGLAEEAKANAGGPMVMTTDATTIFVKVSLNEKVSNEASTTSAHLHSKVKVLTEFNAIANRLGELGVTVSKAK